MRDQIEGTTSNASGYSKEIENYIRGLTDNDTLKSVNLFYTTLSAKEIFQLPVISRDEEEKREKEYAISDLIKEKKRLLLTGPSGAGKTTSLQWVACQYADQYFKTDKEKVPIFVHLVTFTEGTFFDHVIGYVPGFSKETLEYLLKENKAILLIDGLDQVTSKDGFNPLEKMDLFFRSYDCSVVISSRPGYHEWFQANGAFTVAAIKELSVEEIPEYIVKYDPEHSIYDYLIDFINKNEQVESLCQNPMMLAMLIEVAKNPLNKKESLPSTRSELYERVINLVFHHYEKRCPGNTLPSGMQTKLKTVLEELFFSMQCKNQVAIPEQLALENICRTIGKGKNDGESEKILDLLKKINLISFELGYIKYGVHLSFAEYFAACRLSHLFDEGKDVSDAFTHQKWENVVIFTSEMVREPDKFVDEIIKENNLSLAACCVQKTGNETQTQLLNRLVKHAESEYTSEKRVAVSALAKIGSEKATETLIELLKDSDSHVREWAVYALGEIKSEKATNALIELLKDPDPHIRFLAADAMGEIKSEKATETLIELLKDPDHNVRWRVAYALGALTPEKATETLIELLMDANPENQFPAAYALGEIKSEKATETLIERLKDPDPKVRWRVAYALGWIESEKATETLIELLKDLDPEVRGQAAYAMRWIKSEKATETLIELLKDPDPEVRGWAADALGEIKPEQATETLIELLKDPDGGVRWQVADAFRKIKTEQATEALIELLKDPDPEVRGWAADALGEIKPEQATETLIELLKDSDSHVRKWAAGTLGEIKTEKAIEALMELLKDPDPEVRCKVADALGAIKPEQATETLIGLLKNPDGEVRAMGERRLIANCSTQYIPILIQLLNSEYPDVKNTAYDIITQLERESRSKEELDFSDDISRNWWKRNLPENSDIDVRVLQAVLNLAIDISKKGHEGKPIGTSFIIGDSDNVMRNSKRLALNPFEREAVYIFSEDGQKHLNFYSPLDGGSIISGDGRILASNYRFMGSCPGVSPLQGQGTRHYSVAEMTQITKSIGILVSQSGGTISIFRNGKSIKEI